MLPTPWNTEALTAPSPEPERADNPEVGASDPARTAEHGLGESGDVARLEPLVKVREQRLAAGEADVLREAQLLGEVPAVEAQPGTTAPDMIRIRTT